MEGFIFYFFVKRKEHRSTTDEISYFATLPSYGGGHLRKLKKYKPTKFKADKEKSTEKIDGAIATIMGLGRAIRCGTDTNASVYDDRGLFII